MDKKIIAIFTDGKQRFAYVDINGVIYVVRHNFDDGATEEEISNELNIKVEALEPPDVQLSE